MPFDGQIMSRYLSSGDIPSILEYLSTLPDESDTLAAYQRVFAQEPPVFEYPTTDEEMIQILSCYYSYFVFVFGKRHSPEEGKKYLHDLFCQEFSFPKWFPLPWIEGFIGYKVHRLGYHYLGGTTSAYYGPYIWKTTEKTVYSVEIPSGIVQIPVFFMKEFLSNSWLSFLSFNRTGTGGWTKKKGLYCRWDSYVDKLDKPSFTISFLKHEAQHHADFARFGKRLAPSQLEYRAKLCELCYYPNSELLERFINSAKDDPHYAHSQAEYWLVSDLSNALFNQPFLSDLNQWKERYSDVAKIALDLLKNDHRL